MDKAPGVGYFILFVLLAIAGLVAIILPHVYRMPAGPERDSMRGAVGADGSLSTKAKVAWNIVGGVVLVMAIGAIIAGALR
jgi:hypothetical protein